MDEPAEITPQPPKPDSTVVNAALTRLIGSEFAPIGGGIVRSRCKLCNSPFRHEAEKMYETGPKASLPEIKAFLDSKGCVIALQNIKHHMSEHYKSMERMAILVEYCEDLQSMIQQRRSRAEDLEMLVNVGKRELARAISIPTNGDLSKEKDRADMVSKALRSIADGIKALNEMESGEARAKAIQMQFIKVWKEKIAAAKDADERIMLVSSLEDFKKLLDASPEESQ